MDKIKLRSLIIFCRVLWRVFFVENILHMLTFQQLDVNEILKSEINKSWSCLNASLLKRCSGLISTDGDFHSWPKVKNPVWTLFFANRTFDKYQKYFRLSVCILVQTFCKCQTACVICDIWHWDDLWCLKYFLATHVMFMLMSWPPPDTWHRFKNVFCKVNATQRSQDAFYPQNTVNSCLGTVLKIARKMASFSSGFFHIHPTWHWGGRLSCPGREKNNDQKLDIRAKKLVITAQRQKVQ